MKRLLCLFLLIYSLSALADTEIYNDYKVLESISVKQRNITKHISFKMNQDKPLNGTIIYKESNQEKGLIFHLKNNQVK